MQGQQLAQAEAPSDTAKQKPIVVINADKTVGFDKGKKSIMTGNVILRQDSTVIYADTVNLKTVSNSAQAFGNVTIQQNDTTSAFCQELDYDGNREFASMSGEVVLQNGRQKLFSEQLDYDLVSNIAYYLNNAIMTDGERLISSKKGRYYIDSALVVFSDSVVVRGPDYVMRTDSLHFNTITKVATFVSPVRMKQGENNIYCETGYYDLEKNFAELRQKAQFSSPTKKATADTILFYGQSEDISLLGNAWFKESTREVTADRIDYKKSLDKAILIGDVHYEDEEQTAVGERMEYTLSTGAFETEGRAEIYQESQYLAANDMREIPGGRIVRAAGDVVWYDTAQQVSLYCQEAYIDKDDNSVKAFGERLLFITQMEGDSLFVTADTLLSTQNTSIDSLASDTVIGRQLFAYHHVVGFKNDLQFVADSLSFGEQDSLFRIYGNPVIWSDTSRFFGDTIHVQLANNMIDEIFIIDNAFIVNKNNEDFYNQVRGRLITATFVDRKLDRTHVKGNAESIYYAVDDTDAFIGVNKIVCAEMELRFVDSQIGEIRFYRQPTSTFYPILKVDHSSLRLQGFSFDQNYRSRSASDIYRVYDLLKN
jgi:lipopolysaccharide transport protein LptA